MKLFKKKTNKKQKVELTVEMIKDEYPDIYKAIFDKGIQHVHQLGLYADDLKKYPDGEALANKVKDGTMTIEEASLIAVKALASQKREDEVQKEKENTPNNIIGFRPRL